MQQSRDSGPSNSDPASDVYLSIGRITAPHGLHGSVKMQLLTDRPDQISELDEVYFDSDPTPIALADCRIHSNRKQAILAFTGIHLRDEAEALRDTMVKIRGDQLPPPEENAYFHYQILGLRALLESGASIGTVTEIIEAGEVDVYVITGTDGTQKLFPALQEVILDINLLEGVMTIRPQKWVGGDA